jgi:recombinational DNA repair ATPase RecF
MTAAMIMAQAQLICESGERPILLLDDLSSEFDKSHLARVLDAGMKLGVQIWLTGTEMAPALEAYKGSYKTFHVEQGRVTDTGM